MKPLIVAFTILTGVFIMQYLYAASPAAIHLGTIPAGKAVPSPQLKNGKFNGQPVELNMSMTDFVSGAWDYFSNDNAGTPDTQLPAKPVNLSHFTHPGRRQLNVTWLGHSSLMINIDGYRVLTDPVFQKRVSVIGPTRFNDQVPLDISQVPTVDAVIISHDHYDHLNKYSVQQLKDKASKFIVPLGVGSRLVKWGVPAEKIIELDWWEEYRLDQDLMIAATPAQHFSGRGLADRNETLWASWVVRTPLHNLFFSGDSGYFEGFKQIGRKYGPFDMTFIECGAYNESWSQVHMFPEQTVRAHLDLGGNILHPIHWGTFNLALHPWYEPMERVTTAGGAANVSMAMPVVGETTINNSVIPTTKWWRQAMAQQIHLTKEK